MQAIYVSAIYIYPVKSLGGIALRQSEVKRKGLAMDRRWMLMDEQCRFLSQRNIPELALFKMAWLPSGNGFVIQYGERIAELSLQFGGTPYAAQIWSDQVDVVEPDAGLSQWFSDCLGMACKLVAFPEHHPRFVDPDFASGSNDHTSLSDGYPILLIGQLSLDDLNSRLAAPVGFERFRPNIVVEGSLPFEEETWKRFSVGSVAMAGVKPCARCVMTTIDQQTATVGKEPLATLSTYRKSGSKVLFGQNVIPLREGWIRVGDEIMLGT